MDLIERLTTWYAAQCNGEWEHPHGVKIESLDNPGWLVQIDLEGTILHQKEFSQIEHGLEDGLPSDDDWMICSVLKGSLFRGAGDPFKLAAILECFLSWAAAPEAFETTSG